MQKGENMKKQNNNTNYLNTLLKYKLITLKQYYFRKKSTELNIKTYYYANTITIQTKLSTQ